MSVSAQRGLIPTHAGKTGYEAKVSFAQPAHPHSRGENPLRGREKLGGRGSSPLTRGKLGLHMSLIWDIRLIPTHAGKTPRTVHGRNRSRAHPHSRGENHVFDVGGREYCGSSPLTRGKPAVRRHHRGDAGLIPTHAGKTCALARVSQRGEAHPHSRGENVGRLVLMRTHPGSSPLTRGKPLRTGTRAVRLRLIPTHAGKTPSVAVRRGTARAHPHSRGENRVLRGVVLSVGGSSPLTRGKR